MSDILQLLLVGGVFFLMMRFGCGSHGSKKAKTGGHGGGGGCCGGGHASKDTPDTHEKIEAAERVQHAQVQQGSMPPEKDADPVCGMEVETKTAKSSAYEGLVYFFCSQDCRETFEASPEKYIVSNRLEH